MPPSTNPPAAPEEPTIPGDQVAPVTPHSPPEPLVEPPKKLPRRGIFAAVVIVLVAIVGAAWLLNLNNTPPPKSVSTKKDIQDFSYGVLAGPLNSFYPKSGLVVDEITVNQQIFEGLVTYRDKKIVPNLALSWTNPNESTWIFQLKPNVVFHSGRIMTAEDVKYSIEHIMGTELGDVYANTIKSVEVISPSQVKITTDQPDAVLPNKLVFVYIIDSKNTTLSDPVNGTGPYTLSPNTKPSKSSIDLVAFDDYHGGHAGIRNLHLRVYDSDDAVAAALKKGDINLATFSSLETADAIKDNFEPFYIQDPTVYGLFINSVSPGPLQKLKVRQAIYSGIDVKSFVKNIGAIGEAANQIVTKDIPGYNNQIMRPEYNIATAKQLLSEAGYPKGTNLTFSYIASISVLQAAAKEFKRQLAPIGIRITLDPLADDQRSKLDSDKVQLSYSGYASDILDLSDVATFGFQNNNYNNASINRTLTQANRTFDPAARLVLLQEVSKKLMDDVAYVPIYNGISPYLLDKSSYDLPLDIPSAAYPGVYFWRIYEK